MLAAVFHDAGDIRVEEVPVPWPAAGELLLKITAVGICGTDAQEYATGPHMFPIHRRDPVTGHAGPMIPGHELAGRVVAVGEGVSGWTEGALVVCGAGVACGRCWQCRRARTNLCERYASVGLQRNGGLAHYCAVPASVCLSVERHGLDEDTPALAQPMSIAVHAMRRGRLEEGEQALIIGAGGIGAFLTFAAAQCGAQVTVADLDPSRLEVARALGASATILAEGDGPGVAAQVADAGVPPALVYEVSGSRAGLETALAVLPRGGRLVLVGLHKQPRELALREWTLTERELIGTNAHVLQADLPEALRLLAARDRPWNDVAPVALPLAELVSAGLQPLSDGRSDRIKTLIDPWAGAARPTRMGHPTVVPTTQTFDMAEGPSVES